jgi:hypothetical protein
VPLPDKNICSVGTTIVPPPPLPGGTVHVAFSHKYRVDPAVAPGSGTSPFAWVAPDAPKTGIVITPVDVLIVASPVMVNPPKAPELLN